MRKYIDIITETAKANYTAGEAREDIRDISALFRELQGVRDEQHATIAEMFKLCLEYIEAENDGHPTIEKRRERTRMRKALLKNLPEIIKMLDESE
jgi:hypothetical protein